MSLALPVSRFYMWIIADHVHHYLDKDTAITINATIK